MTSGPKTPPPAGRLFTPPAPRHGPASDAWEPYSPRRSSRVQEQEKRKQSNQPHGVDPRRAPKTQTPSQPTSSPSQHQASLKRDPSHQTLSPPSSPEPFSGSSRISQTGRGQQEPCDTDTTAKDRSISPARAPNDMLPTPRKTPHRRHKVTSSSRIITFKPHPQDQILPTPRKRNKRFTLDSPSVSPSAPPIEVHVDSQHRIPVMDRSDDNPFVGTRPRNPHEYRTTVGRRQLSEEERQMQQDVEDGKGLIFMFRGRMMFRPYEDVARHSDDSDQAQNVYSSQTNRIMAAAGSSASRPLTRSDVKPRLLWTADDHLLYEVDSDELDEEALTDIEDRPEPEEISAHANDGASIQLSDAKDDDTPLLLPDESKRGGKKPSPFDNWPRQKPGVSTRSSSSACTKRSVPQPGEESVGKRTRSNDPGAVSSRT